MGNADIRVGVIGAGGNTVNRHIPGLREIEGVEVVGVVNRSPESSRRVADKFGIPKTYENWTDAIEDAETNAIVIGTWPYLHARATVAALEAGKHVMCEARMARDAAEARVMLDTAEEYPDLVAQVVPSPFTLEVDETIRRLLGEGAVGRLQTIRLDAALAGFPDPAASVSWRQDFDLSGFNMLTLGIWYEALMRWVGPAKRVMAMTRTFAPMRPGADGKPVAVRVPDHVDVIADMVCGAQATMRFSAGVGPTARPGVDLCGDAGALRLEGATLLAAGRDDKELKPVEIADTEKSGWRVEAEFVSAIRGEEELRLTTFADGVRYMEFTEAVARSATTGRAVALPLCLD